MTLDADAILVALAEAPGMSTRAVAVRSGFGVRQMKACARELDRLERWQIVASRVIRRGQLRKRFWWIDNESGNPPAGQRHVTTGDQVNLVERAAFNG